MNYYQCANPGIRHKIFFYVDVKDYLADQLFLSQGIRIHWIREFSHKDSEYLVIFCKVLKKNVDKFKMAMDDLKKRMLICGHHDYEKVCDNIMEEITKGGEYRV